jgi:hypothetical protein
MHEDIELLIEEDGFSVTKLRCGIRIAKAGVPLTHLGCMLPALVGFAVLATVSVYAACTAAFGGGAAKWTLRLAFGSMFMAGALGCIWGLAAVLRTALPMTVSLESSDGRNILYRRRGGPAILERVSFERPVRIVAEPVHSRGDWGYRLLIADDRGTKALLTIPTLVSPAKRKAHLHAKRLASSVAGAIGGAVEFRNWNGTH